MINKNLSLNNTQINGKISVNSDEIDLQNLLYIVWQGKKLVLIITILSAVCSVLYALNLPNIYMSSTLLAPAKNEQNNTSGSLAQLGGLASMAGIKLGGDNSNINTAIEVMKSRQFIANFIESHDILPQLIAGRGWNLEDNQFLYDETIYNSTSKKWIRAFEKPYSLIPSNQEAYKAFMKLIFIDKDKDTGMITISMDGYSPYVAQQWLIWFVSDINQYMKNQDVSEAKKSIHFLEEQIAKTNVADIRGVLYKLVEEQVKTIMFAKARNEFVFKTIDPAFVPLEHVLPKRALLCIFGTVFGFILSIGILLFVRFVRKQ